MTEAIAALEELQNETLEVLGNYLTAGQSVALLDHPRHLNAGDSLIWTGARAYLDRLGVSVRYVGTLHHFSPEAIRRAVPQGPILINGGGNLGDRWPEQQAYKERVIKEFTDRQIIQLPQTIEFETTSAATRARRVFEGHPNLVIFVRSKSGLREASALFPNTRLVYAADMALGNGVLERSVRPDLRALVLKRADSESVGELIRVPQGVLQTDWAWSGRLAALRWRALRSPEDVSRIIPSISPYLSRLTARSLHAMAEVNVREASELVSRGEVVVTDRLHAMVMAALLGIPVFAFDNANGKVGTLYREYLHRFPEITLCSGAEEALESALRSQAAKRRATA